MSFEGGMCLLSSPCWKGPLGHTCLSAPRQCLEVSPISVWCQILGDSLESSLWRPTCHFSFWVVIAWVGVKSWGGILEYLHFLGPHYETSFSVLGFSDSSGASLKTLEWAQGQGRWRVSMFVVGQSPLPMLSFMSWLAEQAGLSG